MQFLTHQKRELMGCRAFSLSLLVYRALFLCAVLLAVPTSATAQSSPPPITPGWYSNSSGGTVIHQDSFMRIVWEHSYVYPVPEGDTPLYWYAQVSYQNISGQSLPIRCDGSVLVYGTFQGSPILEGMRNTPNSGYVGADETLCNQNQTYSRAIPPGGKHYDWAIFHNVPWKIAGSQISLTWGPYGPSGWADPWSSPTTGSRGNFLVAGPVECPQELIDLKTCQTGRQPRGFAPNLIVLVHGCCTDEADVWEWRALADQIVGETLNTNSSRSWEIVVWDWTHCHPADPKYECTPVPQALDTILDYANIAYANASDQGHTLALVINNLDSGDASPYQYIHLIAHSAGARLIEDAATQIAAAKQALPDSTKPFIYMSFLDAYVSDNSSDNTLRGTATYGYLPNYPHYYSEQYVDLTQPKYSQNPLLPGIKILSNAYNVDITGWPITSVGYCTIGPFSVPGTQEKCLYGHHWPRYWYEKSVTAHWYDKASGFRYGYPLSLEGGNSNLDALSSTSYPPGKCTKLLDVGETDKCQ